jgi:hypothetical protein
MNQKETPKIATFLVYAFAVAALMYALNYAFQNYTPEPVSKARVSKNDIRRALALPLGELVSLTNDQTSFLNEFASINANMIVIEFPLVVRFGNLVYLEWNQLDIIRMNDVIKHIHRAGMEVAVSASLIDQQVLLDDGEIALEAYTQYVDWLMVVSESSPDALFIHPADFHAKVPASSIIRTFEMLYESYPGKVFLFMDHYELSSSLSHRILAAGYIAESEYLDIHASMVDELDDSDIVQTMVRTSSIEKHSTALFEPYVYSDSDSTRPTAVDEMRNSIDFFWSRDMFSGVIVSGSNWAKLPDTEHQKYRDEIREWFGELKELSRKRAFSKQSAPGMLQ